MRPTEVVGLKAMDDRMKISFKTKQYPTIATGFPLLDQVLLGGFRKGCIIHFYGDPGAGKTSFAMQIMAFIMKQGWGAIWVDCHGGFSMPRFQTILDDQDRLKSLIYVKPRTFQNQTEIVQQLQYHLDRVGIIVVDPFTHFYRAERYREGSQAYFHELVSTQLSTLVGIAHYQKVPVIVVNYGTVNQHGALVPLVEKGFERVEQYRFCFKNDYSKENLESKWLVIERAPESFTQGRVLHFLLGPSGIVKIQLSRTVEDGL